MQFSLFGAEAAQLTLADLDGVLLGGGHWSVGGAGAKLSVVLDRDWRVDALREAFELLGVGDPEPAVAGPTEGTSVARTALTPVLRPMEARWRRGANEQPPDDLMLSAAGLRLWAVTAGVADDVGYLLGTPGSDSRLHRVAGALLARTGIAAVELGARGGPGWRVTSARRLRRLAELIGPPPPGGEADWPSVDPGPTGRPAHHG